MVSTSSSLKISGSATSLRLAGTARSFYRYVADVVDQNRRRRLTVPASPETTDRPTVYFLTPDHDRPAGGIRVIYRHVDVLNACGIPAYVMHQRRGFRCTWFEHRTQLIDVGSAAVRRGDLLVVPEVDADLLERIPAGTRHMIFNQNSHLTWERCTGAAIRARVDSPDLIGILTVSDHNREMLRYAFPGKEIGRVRISIDPRLFFCGPAQRPPRIAFMPRRSYEDARQVLGLLRGRGSLDGWDIVALDGMSHETVAEQLRSTRIFLAFTHQEGFGLPAAEAMACGNYVIGNAGFGGREFFLDDFSSPIESGDVLGFARSIECAVEMDRLSPGWCAERGRRASAHILETYTPVNERADLVSFYGAVLGLDCKRVVS